MQIKIRTDSLQTIDTTIASGDDNRYGGPMDECCKLKYGILTQLIIVLSIGNAKKKPGFACASLVRTSKLRPCCCEETTSVVVNVSLDRKLSTVIVWQFVITAKIRYIWYIEKNIYIYNLEIVIISILRHIVFWSRSKNSGSTAASSAQRPQTDSHAVGTQDRTSRRWMPRRQTIIGWMSGTGNSGSSVSCTQLSTFTWDSRLWHVLASSYLQRCLHA